MEAMRVRSCVRAVGEVVASEDGGKVNEGGDGAMVTRVRWSEVSPVENEGGAGLSKTVSAESSVW